MLNVALARFRKNKVLFAALFLFSLSLALRLILIGGKSLWGDEFYAAGLMGGSISDLVSGSFRGSPHPPLAFLALRLSAALFGTSEAGLRAVPALLSAFAVIPLYLFTAGRLDGRSAFIAGALWAVSPYAVSLGQEAWLYSSLACIGFTFVWVADMAWRGVGRACVLVVPLALAGMLVQHLFLLFVAAGYLLYFTYPSSRRVRPAKPVITAVLTAVLYSPFAPSALAQAALRSERISASGADALAFQRLASGVPAVLGRLIPGGLSPEPSLGMLSSPVTTGIFTGSVAIVILSLAVFFTAGGKDRSLRLWAAGVTVVPFLLFLKEDPTVRHLSILWIPLALSSAALYSRFRPAGIAAVLFAGVLLVPYYQIDSFPYHRSNWREAVRLVLENRTEEQEVVILAGQNGGLAWDYYAGPGSARWAPGGETPYQVQRTSGGEDPLVLVDSLLSAGGGVWVIHDMWGGPVGQDIAPGFPLVRRDTPSPHIEVLFFEN